MKNIKLTTKDKINNAIIWIEHLPDHKQAKGDLKTPKGYCCLGVANKLMRTRDYSDLSGYDFLQPGLGLLSPSGFATALVVRNDNDDASGLPSMNDCLNLGFDEIQNILMSHPENFFEPEVAEGIRAHFGEIDND